jgi:D-tyrosyl-tRNA(Tyr) deacylase
LQHDLRSEPRSAVFFFCMDRGKDPVAAAVFAASARRLELAETGAVVDGHPVLRHRDAAGDVFDYVRTDQVVSHAYPRYLPLLRERFAGHDFAALVNWHEGMNAPDGILCAHTTGDVPSGTFGAADPGLFRNLIRGLEQSRAELGLARFRTLTEATHWSGVPHGGAPELIPSYPVPLVDVEIGSAPESWSDPAAAEAVARALPRVFAPEPPELRSLLCVGGVHFESAFTAAVLDAGGGPPLAVSHILPNQWVASGGYEGPAGLAKLAAAAASIRGGVHGVVFHDNLKGTLKDQLRGLALGLQVPAFQHKKLRRPEALELQ